MKILKGTAWVTAQKETPGNRKFLPPIRAEPLRGDSQPDAQEQQKIGKEKNYIGMGGLLE